jgi:branched-chain amino acid aminotransferase
MHYSEKEIIFLNGKFIPAQEAKISPLSPGFLCGWGLFETMRSYGNNIIYLDQHLARLKRSAALLGLNLPYALNRIKRLIEETARRCGHKDIRLRISVWDAGNSAGFMISGKQYRPPKAGKYQKGFSTCISSLRQAENYPLSRIKLINRILYEFSFRQAKANKCDEALILNNRGYICEASRSNIFFIKDGLLFTPSLKCSCLPGVTRQVIFDLAKKQAVSIVEGDFTIKDLLEAEGAFLTNSLVGIMPLTSVNNIPIHSSRIHPVTRLFIQQYTRLLFTAGVSVII